jgi:limonene-1,2-epoxide hydrolase
MNPENIVRDFCTAIEGRDVAKLAGFFSDDAVYHNIPIAAVQGRDAIVATLGQFLGPATSEAEFEILSLAVAGNRVLTERIDRFTIGDKKVELPVMGTFEMGDDGKITAWRDYFDMNQFSSQLS